MSVFFRAKWLGYIGSVLAAVCLLSAGARGQVARDTRDEVRQQLSDQIQELQSRLNKANALLDVRARAIGELEDSVQQLKQEQKRQLTLYYLKHAAARDAAEMLSQLHLNARFGVDDRLNALLVSASESVNQEVETMLKQVDEEGRNNNKQKVSRRYMIEGGSDFHEAIQELYADEAAVVQTAHTTSPQRVRVMVSATEDTHARIERLIARYYSNEKQRISANRKIHVTWLVAGNSSIGSAVPANLQEVAAELARQGVENVRVAAHAAVRVSLGNTFSIASEANLQSPYVLSVQGEVGPPNDSPEMQIAIEATRGDDADSLARLQTVISAPPNHPVVLGVNPIGKLTSAFVVTIGD